MTFLLERCVFCCSNVPLAIDSCHLVSVTNNFYISCQVVTYLPHKVKLWKSFNLLLTLLLHSENQNNMSSVFSFFVFFSKLFWWPFLGTLIFSGSSKKLCLLLSEAPLRKQSTCFPPQINKSLQPPKPNKDHLDSVLWNLIPLNLIPFLRTEEFPNTILKIAKSALLHTHTHYGTWIGVSWLFNANV